MPPLAVSAGRGPRRALMISPVMPAETGNGLAMRAGVSLEALAADHEVTLLVVPIAGPADASGVPPWAARHAARVVVLEVDAAGDTHFELISRVRDPAARARAMLQYPRPLLSRFATRRALAEAARELAGSSFDLVHVHRLYAAPFAAPFLGEGADARPAAVVDLDDDEPGTRRRLSAMHERRGRPEAAAIEAAEADKYARFEAEWLPRFDRALVCSEGDRTAVAARAGSDRIAVVPNAVRPPAPVLPRPPGDPFTFLLVGSFGYAPNEDAALFFAEEIWPRLVADSPRPVRAVLAGNGPTRAVLGLGRIGGITVAGSVADVAPCYAGADVAVNPVRAGGGTRIKAIEALAHRVPLVSTPVGAEGLDVEHDRHVLIADGAAEFARACLCLVREPALGAALADRAHALFLERYALASVTERLRAVYAALARPRG